MQVMLIGDSITRGVRALELDDVHTFPGIRAHGLLGKVLFTLFVLQCFCAIAV